ncbi:FG-GAP-like repeat-containing protein [Salipiger sp. H15]|uniref:FG-GAP-like repeat-containing protein n=1 Tax=Alloyangia sp. H15 TaxID=3029062 RepID=A0AAU8APC3_9RHOB
MSYSASSMFDFPNFSPTAGIPGAGRIEAEALTIGAGFRAASNPHASGGRYLEATAPASQAGGLFTGATGWYDLTLGYFDESDGVSHMEILVNGRVVDAFDWDSTAGGGIVTAAARAEHTVAGLLLAPGDVLDLRGAAEGGEPLRTDYLEISAGSAPHVPESLRVEAEDFEITAGFSVVRNGAASGGFMLQHSQGSTASARHTVAQAGWFDLTVGYFDETDGVSRMEVLINGDHAFGTAFDSTQGSAIANRASAATLTGTQVWLEAGDTIEITGAGDGGEPFRVDYLDLVAVEGPDDGPGPVARSLDLRYGRDGVAYIALNDGAGGFTEQPYTLPDARGYRYARDYDGDGRLDFLVAWATLLTPIEGNDRPAPVDIDFELTTTFYHNDGGGLFSKEDPRSEVFTITVGTYPYFENGGTISELVQLIDADDLDGDGDIDIVATSYGSESLLVFENRGEQGFELLPPSPAYLGYNGNPGQIGDMNGDGFLDVVISAGNEVSGVVVMLNDGTNHFTRAGALSPSDDGSTNEIIVDMDGDGDNDVLMQAVSDGAGVYVYLNDGTGRRMAEAPAYPLSYDNYVGRMVAGNFDSDPEAEIIMPGFVDAREGIEPGLRVVSLNADRSALELESFDPGIVGEAVAVGDFDGDGDLDFLLVPRLEDLDPDDPIPVQVSLILNDGEGNFTNAGPVTPVFEDERYYTYSNPAVTVGYFDDPFPVA